MTPYKSILYHLDLSILAYHLFAQTLIWPWDPFYEQMRNKRTQMRRDNFMGLVRASLPQGKSITGIDKKTRNNTYCPDHLDPVLADYSRINPTKNCIFRPDGGTKWEVFSANLKITDTLKSGRMVLMGQDINPNNRGNIYNNSGTDRIYFFEGKTGQRKDKLSVPEDGQKTMLGFVLERQDPSDPDKYYLHIGFRGSRSGDAISAFREARKGKGNPDWVTDMQLDSMNHDSEFSPYDKDKVPDGFALSVKSAMDNIFKILYFIQIKRNNTAPLKINLTGHSLGGALAGLCAAWLVQNWKANKSKYNLTNDWDFPINNLTVYTYGAPIFGNNTFIYHYNSIIECKRIKVNLDPITTDSRALTSQFKNSVRHAGALIETSSDGLGTSNHQYDVTRNKIIAELLTKEEKKITPPSPINVYQNFNSIPFIDYNNSNCLLVPNRLDLYNNLVDYLKILNTILSGTENYASGTTAFPTTLRRKKYFDKILASDSFTKLRTDSYTLNNAKFELELKTGNEQDNKWRNFIYLCCILTQITYGQDLNTNPKDNIRKIMKQI
jgi:hypothetical protein